MEYAKLQKEPPQSQEDCDSYNALYYNGKCITKYNAGDRNGPEIPSGIEVTNTTCALEASNNYNCCWSGLKTAYTKPICLVGESADNCSKWSYFTSSAGNYSSTNRTVCMFNAAKTIRDNWAPNGTNKGDWILATEDESKKISNIFLYHSTAAFTASQFCIDTNLMVTDSCSGISGGCFNSLASVPENRCITVSKSSNSGQENKHLFSQECPINCNYTTLSGSKKINYAILQGFGIKLTKNQALLI